MNINALCVMCGAILVEGVSHQCPKFQNAPCAACGAWLVKGVLHQCSPTSYCYKCLAKFDTQKKLAQHVSVCDRDAEARSWLAGKNPAPAVVGDAEWCAKEVLRLEEENDNLKKRECALRDSLGSMLASYGACIGELAGAHTPLNFEAIKVVKTFFLGARQCNEVYHDSLDADKGQGLYEKYKVTRTDGRSAPGEKHEKCRYFVLDLTHDEFARPALEAYAKACRAKYPKLAADLEHIFCTGSQFLDGHHHDPGGHPETPHGSDRFPYRAGFPGV